MDQCSWSKSIATHIIQQTTNETVLKVAVLGGTSDNPEDSGSHAKPKIRWDNKTYDLTLHCSYQRPTIAMGSQSDVLPLNASGVPSYLESGAALYFK
ncbi:MAG: hypothetical protein KGO49_02855, partial [Gammaproteobacteria bacterium]|nr:hypothetical protein [Gammaproteobacteria bacterium]